MCLQIRSWSTSATENPKWTKNLPASSELQSYGSQQKKELLVFRETFFLSLVPNWIGFINIQRQIMEDESWGVPESPRLIFMINSRIFPCEPVFPYLGDARKMRRLMRLHRGIT